MEYFHNQMGLHHFFEHVQKWVDCMQINQETFGKRKGKKIINNGQQSRMTFNFLNPDSRKNLHLVNRVWVEEKDPDFKEENKE